MNIQNFKGMSFEVEGKLFSAQLTEYDEDRVAIRLSMAGGGSVETPIDQFRSETHLKEFLCSVTRNLLNYEYEDENSVLCF